MAHAHTNTGKYTMCGNLKRMCRLDLPWLRQISTSKLATGCAELHLCCEGIQVSGLQINRSRSFEPASKAFPRAETRNEATRCNTDHLIITIPSHEMSVVDDVYFFVNELSEVN